MKLYTQLVDFEHA